MNKDRRKHRNYSEKKDTRIAGHSMKMDFQPKKSELFILPNS